MTPFLNVHLKDISKDSQRSFDIFKNIYLDVYRESFPIPLVGYKILM